MKNALILAMLRRPRTVLAATLVAGVTILASPAAGALTIRFSPPFEVAAGSGPFGLTALDVNGDGKPDLAAANSGGNDVSVFLNQTTDGAATPVFGPRVDFPTGLGSVAVTSGDINGDGTPDLITGNYTANTVSVLLNATPSGGTTPAFAAARNFMSGGGTSPASVAVGDLDGDGDPDIVTANEASNNVSILVNHTPSGGTTPLFGTAPPSPAGIGPVRVAVGDVNGDGKPDLVTASAASNIVSVLINRTITVGSPNFGPPTNYGVGNGASGLAVGDYNGDGQPDLAASTDAAGTVAVLVNRTASGATTPNLDPPVTFNVGNGAVNLDSGDVDGDGDPDLVVTRFVGNTITVLENRTSPAGTPAFTQTVITTGAGPYDVLFADLNRDAKPDVAASGPAANKLYVNFNTSFDAPVSGQITATVFEDVNGNGTHDAGEPGLPSRLVFLDLNDDGDIDTGEPTGPTNGAGVFTFTGLAAGNYLVRATGLGPGFVRTTPDPAAITIDQSNQTASASFGVFKHGVVSGKAFEDLDGDGIQDPNEPGLEGFTIYVDLNLNETRDPTDPHATTGPDGAYQITGLPPGFAAVRAEPRDGFEDPGAFPINVTSGFNFSYANFAFTRPVDGTITTFVYNDANGNGLQDPGDIGFAGVQVFLDENGDGQPSTGERRDDTDSFGFRAFTALEAGTYQVHTTWTAVGSIQTTPNPPAITIDAANPTASATFGLFRLGQLSGQVFEDRNGNGSQDPGEPALGDVSLFIDRNGDGVFGAGDVMTATDAQGAYSFAGLRPGAASLVVPPQTGFEPVTPYAFSVVSGFTERRDLGLVPLFGGSIVVQTFEDMNGNGTLQTGEPPLPGARPFLDANGNGILDTGEPNGVTDNVGKWTFTGLAAGRYQVEVSWNGYDGTSDAPYVVLDGSTPLATVTVGAARPGEVSGTVYHDRNADDVRDPGEEPLEGWDLLVNGTREATTNELGGYIFPVPPGLDPYRVAVGTQPGWEPSDVEFVMLTITSGVALTKDFGFYQPASIAGTMFDDRNRNGVQDAGEAGLLGWTVYDDANDNGALDSGEQSATTGADGKYQVEHLRPGRVQRRLREVLKPGWEQTTPDPAPITLSSGQSLEDVDFGNFQFAATPDPGARLVPDGTNPALMELQVVGTSGNDTIDLTLRSGAIRVYLNGESLGDFSPTGRVDIHGLEGNDEINVSSRISRAVWVHGGPGNDVVTVGGRGNNVLVGGDGDDQLYSAIGRDLHIGGRGADLLSADTDNDIVISGFTVFDDDALGLAAIMGKWTSAGTYAERVANLRVVLVLGSTVQGDSAVDELFGRRGLDWFLADDLDMTDRRDPELLN